MPWTISGFVRDNSVFTGPTVWTEDRDAGTKITADHHDYHDQDIADGITLCLRRDGGNRPTADINWGAFSIQNLGLTTSPTGAATVGQTITAASLDSGTNILTLTRNAGDVTVDLTPLVVGGSTADFARLSTDNTFAGTNHFNAVHISAGNGLTFDAGTNILQWDIQRDNTGWYLMRNGGEFLRIENSGTDLFVASSAVWTAANLDPSGFLTTASNPVITGTWNFTSAGGILLPDTVVFGSIGNSWNATTSSAGSWQLFANASAALVKVDYPSSAVGTRLMLGSDTAWHTRSLAVATAKPSDATGQDGWITIVRTGADRGLYVKVTGAWTLMIAFP